MALPFDFLILRRPVSTQTNNRRNLQAWKRFVHNEAAQFWNEPPLSGALFHLTLVYLCDETNLLDTDNIIKPIQDALVGLVYEDDVDVIDVEAHRRPIGTPFDVLQIPSVLLQGVLTGNECVFVRVDLANRPVKDFL